MRSITESIIGKRGTHGNDFGLRTGDIVEAYRGGKWLFLGPEWESFLRRYKDISHMPGGREKFIGAFVQPRPGDSSDFGCVLLSNYDRDLHNKSYSALNMKKVPDHVNIIYMEDISKISLLRFCEYLNETFGRLLK